MVKQAKNERNYHIFYQLVNGADQYLAQLLEIDNGINYLYLGTDMNHSGHFENQVCWTYYRHTTIIIIIIINLVIIVYYNLILEYK